jgi:hypothetical protein
MIPISDAADIAEKRTLRQVIIFGWDGRETFVTTYGGTDWDSAGAAGAANRIKDQWDWPANTIVEGERVQKLYNRIAELEAQLATTVKQCADAGDAAWAARCPFICDYIVESMGLGVKEGAAAWRSK